MKNSDYTKLVIDIEYNIIKKYPKYILELEKLDQKSYVIYKDIYSKYNDCNDTRVSVFGKIISIINSTRLGMVLTNKYFDCENWIKKYDEEINKRELKEQLYYIVEYDTSLRFSFFQQLFSNFESTIKIINRHLKSNGKKCADDYKGFITQTLKIRNDNDEFLKLIQWTRNSIHNNGLHFPDEIKKGKVDKIPLIYKGQNIEFKYGFKIDFLNWNIALLIAEDIIDLMVEVINHPIVKNEIKILDPVVKNDKMDRE